jgi:hypothetical protein
LVQVRKRRADVFGEGSDLVQIAPCDPLGAEDVLQRPLGEGHDEAELALCVAATHAGRLHVVVAQQLHDMVSV